MGSFSRLRYVIAANVNSLLEKAEDPEKLLRALIRDMEDASEDARLASADLLAEQAHLQRMKDRFEREIGEWEGRAEKAEARVKELEALLSGIKWRSIDKDNMEFEARTTCYTVDRIRKALEGESDE